MKNNFFITDTSEENKPKRFAKNKRIDMEKDIENTLGMENNEASAEDINKGFLNYLIEEKSKFTDFKKIEEHYNQLVMEKHNEFNNNKVKILEMKQEYKLILQTIENYMVTFFKFGSVSMDQHYESKASELRLEIKKKECELNSYNNLYKNLYKTNYLINKEYSDEINLEICNDNQNDKYKMLENYAVTTTTRQAFLLNTLKELQEETMQKHETERNNKMQKLNKLNMQIIEIKKDVMSLNKEIMKVVNKQTNLIKNIKEIKRVNKKIKMYIKGIGNDYHREYIKLLIMCRMLNIEEITDIPKIISSLNILNTDIHKLNTDFDIENNCLLKMTKGIRRIEEDKDNVIIEKTKEIIIDKEGKQYDKIRNEITRTKGVIISLTDKIKNRNIIIFEAFYKISLYINMIYKLKLNVLKEKEKKVKEEMEQKRSLNPNFLRKKKDRVFNLINYIGGEAYYFEEMIQSSLKNFYENNPNFRKFFNIHNEIINNDCVNDDNDKNIITTPNTISNNNELNNPSQKAINTENVISKSANLNVINNYIVNLDSFDKETFYDNKESFLFFCKLFLYFVNNIYSLIQILYKNIFYSETNSTMNTINTNSDMKLIKKPKEDLKSSSKSIINKKFKREMNKALRIYTFDNMNTPFTQVFYELLEEYDQQKMYNLQMVRKLFNEQKMLIERDQRNIDILKNNANKKNLNIPVDDLLHSYMSFVNKQKETSGSNSNKPSNSNRGRKSTVKMATNNINTNKIFKNNNINIDINGNSMNLMKHKFQNKNLNRISLGKKTFSNSNVERYNLSNINGINNKFKIEINPLSSFNHRRINLNNFDKNNKASYHVLTVLSENEEGDPFDIYEEDEYNNQKYKRKLRKTSRNNKMLDMKDVERAKVYFRANEIRNFELLFFGDKKKNFFDTYTFHTLYYNYRTKKKARKFDTKPRIDQLPKIKLKKNINSSCTNTYRTEKDKENDKNKDGLGSNNKLIINKNTNNNIITLNNNNNNNINNISINNKSITDNELQSKKSLSIQKNTNTNKELKLPIHFETCSNNYKDSTGNICNTSNIEKCNTISSNNNRFKNLKNNYNISKNTVSNNYSYYNNNSSRNNNENASPTSCSSNITNKQNKFKFKGKNLNNNNASTLLSL